MTRKYFFLAGAIGLISGLTLFGQTSSEITPFIRAGQFGYLPAQQKIAVIADPYEGFDAAEEYRPGTRKKDYEVRSLPSHKTVFRGTIAAWNNGQVHGQSGDKGWYFDFSRLRRPGEYYIFDKATGKASFPFRIGDDVYDEVLKQVVRVFFYQRVNFPKKPPYADEKWADEAAFDAPGAQGYAVRNRWAKDDPSTERDLHGGWFDAGDPNKYTTFASEAVRSLIDAMRKAPQAFGDNFGIPESGNGIPGLLDELMWELDWLKRMQDATGTGGFLLRVCSNFILRIENAPFSLILRCRTALMELASNPRTDEAIRQFILQHKAGLRMGAGFCSLSA